MSDTNANPAWSYRASLDSELLRERLATVAERSQYGWGQSVLVGQVVQEGFLGWKWRNVLAKLDEWGWLPSELVGQRVADVGCFSGAMSLVMADRGAHVVAVDEVPEHLDQARALVELLAVDRVETVEASLYDLHEKVPPASFDIVLLSGVLYHLSDMLAGLIAVQQLLKPGGVLLIQTNAVENFEASYANFGRFYAGWWWQPSALCIQDLCEFAGLERPTVRFYEPGRCLARAAKPLDAVDGEAAVPYKRGVHWPFADLADRDRRHLDVRALAPAPDPRADSALAGRWLHRVIGRVARALLDGAASLRGRVQRRNRS